MKRYLLFIEYAASPREGNTPWRSFEGDFDTVPEAIQAAGKMSGTVSARIIEY